MTPSIEMLKVAVTLGTISSFCITKLALLKSSRRFDPVRSARVPLTLGAHASARACVCPQSFVLYTTQSDNEREQVRRVRDRAEWRPPAQGCRGRCPRG